MFRSPVVDVYVTGICNLGCRYCFGELDTKPGMKRDVFLHALSFAKYVQANAIEFCGGEPLLYKDFEWAVEQARSRGFRLILRTNGFYLGKRRSFIAANFDSIGISLDGDAQSNDEMRPIKGRSTLTAEQKYRIPLNEIWELKALNPDMQVLLASVASRVNADGLVGLARSLVSEKVPLDLWKVYHFVANNFRAKENEGEFTLDLAHFLRLRSVLEREIAGAFPLVCRTSDQIDGSCLVVNRDGNVLLGAARIGSVVEASPAVLCAGLEQIGKEASILQNKTLTYKRVVAA